VNTQKHVTLFNKAEAFQNYETFKNHYSTDTLHNLSDVEQRTVAAALGFMEFIINSEYSVKDGEVFDIRGLLFVSYRSIAELRPMNAEMATAIQYITKLLLSLFLDIEE
jgi:hypothetical protein